MVRLLINKHYSSLSPRAEVLFRSREWSLVDIKFSHRQQLPRPIQGSVSGARSVFVQGGKAGHLLLCLSYIVFDRFVRYSGTGSNYSFVPKGKLLLVSTPRPLVIPRHGTTVGGQAAGRSPALRHELYTSWCAIVKSFGRAIAESPMEEQFQRASAHHMVNCGLWLVQVLNTSVSNNALHASNR